MFDGYILVGGQSSRMKTDEAALLLGALTFAERAAALRNIAGGRIHFVVGANQTDETGEILPANVPQITDAIPDKAALGGIYTALLHSENEWAAILAGDYPLVTEDFLRVQGICRTTRNADSGNSH